MASKSSTVSGSAGDPEDGVTGSQKPKIYRTRTGCLTCRRRRKKCDETRPACKACVKTNVFCEGYPPRTVWGAKVVGERASKSKVIPNVDAETLEKTGETMAERRGANLNLFPLHNSSVYDDEVSGVGGEMNQWFNMPMLPQSSAISLDQRNERFGPADDDYNVAFQQSIPQFGWEEHFGSTMLPMSAFNSPRDDTGSLAVSGKGGFESRISRESRPRCVPPQLPFLISGVESSLHRRLLYHFTHVMSRVLTTFGDDSNPMNSIVIPLALADSTLMQILLSLACSHLLKLQPSGTSPELSGERNLLHQKALHAQTQRLYALKETAATGSQSPSQDQDAVLATSLLLCLYEICEGTGRDGWRLHLQMARELLSITTTETMNPFLLEFFLYHDSFALVTVPSSARRINYPTSLSHQNPSLVGVQDGLIEYVTRISSLRSEAGSSLSPKYDIINKALEIWDDLFRWKPQVTLCKDRDLIAHLYQWALFIWLFSIVYPDGKSDPKVQSAVEWMVDGLSEIKSGDGAMAVLLFPLFIVGSAAIRQEDRNAVAEHFKLVRAWSSLGNVDLTFELVKKMWQDHDAGLPRSWDWVIQLERHGMSLLVT